MTKKVNKETIKKLIEEALKEEVQIKIPNLDYGTASSGAIDNEDERKIKKFFGSTPARGRPTNQDGVNTGVYNHFSRTSQKSLYDMLKDLAGTETEVNVLDREDFEERLGFNSDPDEDLNILNGVMRILNDEKRKTISSEKRAEYSKIISSIVSEASTVIYNDLNALENKLKSDKSGDYKWIKRALRSRKLVTDQNKLSEINKMIYGVVSDPSLEIPEEVQADLNNNILKMREPLLDPFGRTADPRVLQKQSGLVTNQEDFKKNSITNLADSNLLAKFQTIRGSSILEKMNSLSEFATKISKGNEGIEEWVKSNNQFDLINYSAVLSLLGDLPAQSPNMAAGEGFEVWLALFLNMPIVGAEQGLVDNIGKSAGGDMIYTSAKLLANACRAAQAAVNFDKHFSSASSATYFVFEKIGQTMGPTLQMTRVNSMNCYLVYVEKKPNQSATSKLDEAKKRQDLTGSDSNYQGRLLSPDGRTVYGPYTLKYHTNTKIGIMPCADVDASEDFSDFVFANIPLNLPDLIKDSNLDSTAQYLSKMIKSTGSEFNSISKKVMTAYETLQLIEQNTDNYTSSKSIQSDKESSTYVRGIGDNFTIFKNTINSIFNEAGEEEGSMLKEANKITSNFLKKLISESFKR